MRLVEDATGFLPKINHLLNVSKHLKTQSNLTLNVEIIR